MNEILNGDCLELMKLMGDNTVDAVVTDPPYGLSFMGKKWDYDVPNQEIWEECLRVLKPGGYLLAFAGTRTQHRMAVRIEDAGFEIRDMISWVYGSGFPKSLNIGKAIDAMQGNDREVIKTGNTIPDIRSNNYENSQGKVRLEETITKGNSEWEGWGTALKPSFEPITVARKPLSEKTVALNVLKWGTGGIDIDGSRVGEETIKGQKAGQGFNNVKGFGINTKQGDELAKEYTSTDTLGRFPANFIHDGSDEVLDMFPHSTSGEMNCVSQGKNYGIYGKYKPTTAVNRKSSGSASRFFYCAKASKSERNVGCESLELTRHADRVVDNGVGGDNPRNRSNTSKKNFHPTVKPIALMEYLVKLVSRENAVILDPFGGSGTTAVACKNVNRQFIIMERELDYVEIIKKRVGHIKNIPKQQTLF